MSLLEDVFLEDEAGEAQELERVIEGDEFDDRPESVDRDSDNNSEKEDEAVEDKRRVDPTQAKTKRVIKNPRFILNPARLTGPRGIHVIPEHFKDFKFKGKGHEKEDLDLILKKMEHWAYRLYPKFEFEDCLKKIEMLGRKRPVMVHLHKIRSDQYSTEETVVQRESSDEETPAVQEDDEFDKLLQQQIELARATPAPDSVKKPAFSTPKIDFRSPLTMPKATSSPSITDEQKERMLQNKRLAEERRLARLKNVGNNDKITNTIAITVEDANQNIAKRTEPSIINEESIVVENYADNDRINDDVDEPRKKKNKSNVIDSSDEECEEIAVNESITVDVHNNKHLEVDSTIEDIVISDNKNSKGVDIEMQSDESNTVLQINDRIDNENSNDISMSNDEIVEDILTNDIKVSDKDQNDIEVTSNNIVAANSASSINNDTESNDNFDKIDVENNATLNKDNVNKVSPDDENECDRNNEENGEAEHCDCKVTQPNDNTDNILQEINQCDDTVNKVDTNEKPIESTEENIKNNDDDDLMDVDFSEEF